MRKLANGLGMINRLIGRLIADKGGVLAVAVMAVLLSPGPVHGVHSTTSMRLLTGLLGVPRRL